MSNKVKPPRKFNLDHFIDDQAAAAIVFEFKGEEFSIPAQALWPDRMPSALRAGYDALGRAVLGDEQWERYSALGGTGRVLNAFYAHATEETQGVSLGE